jgi:Xaa-Pro aminopeptidase
MLDTATFHSRRDRLTQAVDGPIVLLGNGTRSRNLPMLTLPFRQDSSFLYYTGCDLPDATALIERDRFVLFLPEKEEGDELWHGPTPDHAELAARFGADQALPPSGLADLLRQRRARTLAVADHKRNVEGSAWSTAPLSFGTEFGDPELVQAVIAMRRTKSADELLEMASAAKISTAAHHAVIAATAPGVTERALAALFEAVIHARGATPGYGTILTQHGEILHQFKHEGTLEAGKLLLLDGGAEVPSGYGCDITRTWPVDGRFTARQAAAYDVVLAAQRASIARCTRGTPYREVHDASSLVIARFLVDEGLLRCSPESAVERSVQALFFPHGVGHHLGMDVHDLENFGDLSSYAPGAQRPDAFGTQNLRLSLPLEEGWVVTVEPGFYVVPAILADGELRDRFRDDVDWDRAESWLGFGGIRIEDDVAVTAGEPLVLTDTVVKERAELEAMAGSAQVTEILCGR